MDHPIAPRLEKFRRSIVSGGGPAVAPGPAVAEPVKFRATRPKSRFIKSTRSQGARPLGAIPKATHSLRSIQVPATSPRRG